MTLGDSWQVTFDRGVMLKSVTLSGDVFSPSGTLSGGARLQKHDILQKMAELLDHEEAMMDKVEELKHLDNEIAKTREIANK